MRFSKIKCLWRASVVALLAWPVALPTAVGDESEGVPSRRTIKVTGSGSVNAPPDMAVFQTGVVSQAARAADALRQNNEATDSVLKLLKDVGISDKDIQTLHINVSPQYAQRRRSREEEPRIVGYEARNELQVTVRNLPHFGAILDAVIDGGSNQVSGIRFDIDDKRGLRDQARNRAVKDAQHRAQLYANAAGVEVGAVLSLQEAGGSQPRPTQLNARMATAERVPIAKGQLTIQASVQMTFAIKQE